MNLGMDTNTPTGKIMLTVLGGIAQFEREMMLERQRESIAKGKAAGQYRGCKGVAIQWPRKATRKRSDWPEA